MIAKSEKSKQLSLYLILLAIAIACACFFYLKNYTFLFDEKMNKSEHLHTLANAENSTNFKSEISPTKTPDNLTKNTPGKSNSLEWNPDDPQLKAQLNSWYESRGWFETIDSNTTDDYRTYTKETLQQLANDGDIRALQLLASRASKSEFEPLLTKAAIHGSVFAFSMFSNAIMSHGGITEHSNRLEKLPLIIEAAAYGEVAKMRGNFLISGDSDIAYLESTYGINLTAEENQTVLTRAREIYTSLESQRINMGLGKFDNTIPPIVQAYYRAMGVLPK